MPNSHIGQRMDYTHSLLGRFGQLHSDFIINLKCEWSSFCFLKYNPLLGPFISLKPRFHGLWNTKMQKAANDKWNPLTEKHYWDPGRVSYPLGKSQRFSNGTSPCILCPPHKCVHFESFRKSLMNREKIQFRWTSPLGLLTKFSTQFHSTWAGLT